jgi:hypothetical protein
MNKIIQVILLIIATLSFTFCTEQDEHKEGIAGAWILRKINLPDGTELNYPIDGSSFIRLYDNDNTYYYAELMTVGKEILVVPLHKSQYLYSDTIYKEEKSDDNLYLKNDTTIILQSQSFTQTWTRATTMTEEKKQEIRDIVKNHIDKKNVNLTQYVLSTTERDLRSQVTMFHLIVTILILIVGATALYAFHLRKQKKNMERKLNIIEEEKENRPQLIDEAIKKLEDDFFKSQYYVTLRHNIEAGKNMTDKDWTELEQKIKGIYPTFTSTLYGLYNFSPIEYQVCLLLKIHTSPSEIANVINKDISTISNIRRRLYKKIFDKDASAKEWDDFIASL